MCVCVKRDKSVDLPAPGSLKSCENTSNFAKLFEFNNCNCSRTPSSHNGALLPTGGLRADQQRINNNQRE